MLEPDSVQQSPRSFVLHHKTKWDSLLTCPDTTARNQVLQAIKYLHWERLGKNLPIFRIPEKLQNRIIVRKERMKNQSGSKPRRNLCNKYRDFSLDMYAVSSQSPAGLRQIQLKLSQDANKASAKVIQTSEGMDELLDSQIDSKYFKGSESSSE